MKNLKLFTHGEFSIMLVFVWYYIECSETIVGPKSGGIRQINSKVKAVSRLQVLVQCTFL